MITETQLLLAIGIPSLLALVNLGSTHNLRAELNSRFDRMEARFDRLESKQDRMQADLTMFNHELGRHDAEIDALKARPQ